MKNLKIRRKKIVLFVILLIILALAYVSLQPNFSLKNKSDDEIKIGYFHGGRVFGLYRSYVYDANTHLGNNTTYFEKENVNVKLYSQIMLEDGWSEVPKYHKQMTEKYRSTLFGKVSGIRIIDAIEDSTLDGGTPGESSFVQKVVEGSPIVAVALLGHDTNDAPGKVLVLRNGFIVNSTDDFKGKTFGSRRAGPGDRIFLSEFFKSIGLDPEKDVTIRDQIPDDLQISLLKSKQLDGALFHLYHVPRLTTKHNAGYVYRRMDWMNSEISQAVLVFHKDFVEEHPEEVEKVVRAYMQRLKYEEGLPDEEKIGYEHPETDLGLQIRFMLNGSSTPVYDYPPLVRTDLLEDMQDLLFEYNEIDKKVDLNKFVDNSFVEKIYEELK